MVGSLPKDATSEDHVDETSGTVIDEGGFVLAWFGLMLIVLVGLGGMAIDIGNWYYQASKMQKAADAAALAGVVYMPGPVPGPASVAANKVITQNGFDPASTTVASGANPAQLKVTIDRTIPNLFIQVLGLNTQRLVRTAVAEYSGPIPMGSPANNLGNEPLPPGDSPWGKVLTSGAQGQYWVNIAGPQATKVSGDRFQARMCNASVANCTSAGSTEYDKRGYAYKVRVKAAFPGQRLAVEVFDPMFVLNGDTCTNSNISTATPYNPVLYASGPGAYCTGDENVGGPALNLRTSYILRAPDLTPSDSFDNPIINTGLCVPQVFGAFIGASLGPQVANPTTDVARYWRRWVRVCDLPLTGAFGAGDYVLQVTTGQRWNAATSSLMDQMVGTGHNRLAIRAGLISGAGVLDNTNVELFADGRLPIYANARGADTRFYLARVLPGSDGRRLKIEFFDVGDASQPGTITVLPPPDATVAGSPITQFSNCPYSGPAGSGTLASCSLPGVSSGTGYNGKVTQVTVPIPNAYSCLSANPQGCWVRVRFTYPAGTNVNDTTTWLAKLEGDPVRLTQ